MNIKLYRFLSLLAGPLIDVYFLKRRLLGKEDKTRYRERLGHASLERPEGKLLWIHGASIGEAMAVLPLIRMLLEQYPTVNVLVTTGTVTSAKLLQERLPARAFHQYVPIDRLFPVRRFLDHWQPDAALWVESELWPNLVVETQKRGTTMIQVNARISEESTQRWHKYNALAHTMLRCFSLCITQSDADKMRFESLGSDNVRTLDNLKYDAPPLPADPAAAGVLIRSIGKRPVWLAASTHQGEDELIAQVHTALAARFPDLLTIIVPRHPNRADTIRAQLSQNFTLAQRSKDEKIIPETQIYLADTIGELGLFYRVAPVVFMGGSLVPHGGQNPLEPARLDCALLTGPYTDNFTQIYDSMIQHQAVLRVEDVGQLTEQVARLLQNHSDQQRCAARAARFMESKSGVTKAYLEMMQPYLHTVLR